MPQSLTCLVYHLVFSTKERRKLLLPHLRSRLNAYTGWIIRTDNGIQLAAGGTDDHTHILGLFNKNLTIPESVKNIKALSTRWIHETFPELRLFCWQGGYAAFTVSTHVIPTIKAYIEQQEEHHRTKSFKEESIELLETHGIEYNKRYLWD